MWSLARVVFHWDDLVPNEGTRAVLIFLKFIGEAEVDHERRPVVRFRRTLAISMGAQNGQRHFAA